MGDQTLAGYLRKDLIATNELYEEPAERDRDDSRGRVERPGDCPGEQVKQDD